MIYTLENEHLKISLSNHGGELHSIKGKKDNTEFLWSGDEAYWKYHAPILFPIVGKVFNSKYTVDGKTYELPQVLIIILKKSFDFITSINPLNVK